MSAGATLEDYQDDDYKTEISSFLSAAGYDWSFNQNDCDDPLKPQFRYKLRSEDSITPYSIKTLNLWCYNISKNNKVIDLDFDKILIDLKQLIKNRGKQTVFSMFFVVLGGYECICESILHYILTSDRHHYP